MDRFNIIISVPMSFNEDDALYVLDKTFHRLSNVRAVASKPIIRPVGLDHSFDVDFEAFGIRRRIPIACTIGFVNSENCHYYGDITNKVSEELYCRLRDRIEIETSFSSQAPKVASTWKYEYRPCIPRLNYIKPVKVIFNNPATIVIWSDGTKTVVKRQRGDRYNKEAGLALCYVKKFCGNNTSRGLNDILKLANNKEEK